MICIQTDHPMPSLSFPPSPRQMEIKKERRKKEKAIKEEKKQRNLALRNVPDENGKKRQITEDGETVRARKREKGKRVAKLKRVLPPKAERKAAKKERKEVKAAAKAAIRKKVAIERAKKRASREASRGGEGAN